MDELTRAVSIQAGYTRERIAEVYADLTRRTVAARATVAAQKVGLAVDQALQFGREATEMTSAALSLGEGLDDTLEDLDDKAFGWVPLVSIYVFDAQGTQIAAELREGLRETVEIGVVGALRDVAGALEEIAQVDQSIQGVSSGTQQIRASAQEMHRFALELRKQVSRFKV